MKNKNLLLNLLLIPFIATSLLIFIIAAQIRWHSIGKLTWINIGSYPFTDKYFECIYYERNLVFFQHSSATLFVSVESVGYLGIMPGGKHEKGFFGFLLPDCNHSLFCGTYYYDVQKKHFVDRAEYLEESEKRGYTSYDIFSLNFCTLKASGYARDFYRNDNKKFAEQVKSLL